MPARFSLLVLLAGCDLAFGVSGQPEPCELGRFANPEQTTIVGAMRFSVDWDQTFAVIEREVGTFEVSLPDATLTPIDLGLYMTSSLALAPEGSSLLYTVSVEPYELRGALRLGDGEWQLDAEVPRGAFAGTPSADAFGPRRVLIREELGDTDLQEYEVDDTGHWVRIGSPFPFPGEYAPNLTPNGLTMVYSDVDNEGVPGVYAASRDDVDSAFGDPMLLRVGDLRSPQLCGRCQQLYAIVPNPEPDGVDRSLLVRFDR